MGGKIGLRHLILGLLVQRPMSGYDIKRLLKGFSWLVGSPSFGSLYPALRSLLEEGLVMEECVSFQNKRGRRSYCITEAGKQALQEWSHQPAEPDASLKSFVMRLILAGNFSRPGLFAHLQQRRSQVAVHRATLNQMMGSPDKEMEPEQRLAHDFGLALATAELSWLDRTIKRLFQSLSVEGRQEESVDSKV